MAAFERFVEITCRILMYVCAGLLLAMLFLSTTDILGRYLFNRPITGALEVLEILLPAMVLLSLAYTQKEKAHVTVDIVFSHLPRRSRAVLGLLTTFWAFVLFAVIVWRGIMQVLLYHQTRMVITNISVPVFLPRMLVPIGAFAVCLVLAVDFIHFLDQLRRKD
jgi:TRAP-type transport system small permease protein